MDPMNGYGDYQNTAAVKVCLNDTHICMIYELIYLRKDIYYEWTLLVFHHNKVKLFFDM